MCGGRRSWRGCHREVNLVVKLIDQLLMGIGELTWRLKRVVNQAEGKKGDGGAEGRERYDGVRRLTEVKGSISLPCKSNREVTGFGETGRDGLTHQLRPYPALESSDNAALRSSLFGDLQNGYSLKLPFSKSGRRLLGPAIPVPHLGKPQLGKTNSTRVLGSVNHATVPWCSWGTGGQMLVTAPGGPA